jgi:predicted HTH domain antitoxin
VGWVSRTMQYVTIGLSDEFLPALASPSGDLEALATEAYREGKISHSQLRRLLGLQTRTDVDAFLKDRGVELEYTAEDLERDRETLKRFGV